MTLCAFRVQQYHDCSEKTALKMSDNSKVSQFNKLITHKLMYHSEMCKAVYICTLKGFWDILKQYRNRWHLIAVIFQSLAVFSGHTKMINDNIFFCHIDSALCSPHFSLSNWGWLLSLSGCATTQGGFSLCTLKWPFFSMGMLFSLKSCFLGPCRKALEWEIQWIIYWSDWVRYVAVYFKTVKNSVQWIAAFWCDFLLIVAFQSLRSKIESMYWSGCWAVFLFADMAWALCALKLKAWGMLSFCLARYRPAFSSATE